MGNELIGKFYNNLVDELTTKILDTTLNKKNIEKVDDKIIIEKLNEGFGISPTDSSDVILDFILYTPLKDTLVDTYRNIVGRRGELDIRNFEEWSLVAPKLKMGGKYRVFFPSDNNPNYSLRFPCVIYELHLKNVGPKGSLIKVDQKDNSSKMGNKNMRSTN